MPSPGPSIAHGMGVGNRRKLRVALFRGDGVGGMVRDRPMGCAESLSSAIRVVLGSSLWHGLPSLTLPTFIHLRLRAVSVQFLQANFNQCITWKFSSGTFKFHY